MRGLCFSRTSAVYGRGWRTYSKDFALRSRHCFGPTCRWLGSLGPPVCRGRGVQRHLREYIYEGHRSKNGDGRGNARRKAARRFRLPALAISLKLPLRSHSVLQADKAVRRRTVVREILGLEWKDQTAGSRQFDNAAGRLTAPSANAVAVKPAKMSSGPRECDGCSE